MKAFELMIGLCLVAVVLAGIARRVGAPYPAFQAIGGACLGLVPGVPRFELRPELALALFVAPVLPFSVVLGTLVLQGLTLKPLLRWLDLRDDDPVSHELDLARSRVLEAVLASLGDDGSITVQAVREEYEALLVNDAGDSGSGDGALASTREEVHRRALSAARHVISHMRSSAAIGDDAFHKVEEDLDRIEFATFPR